MLGGAEAPPVSSYQRRVEDQGSGNLTLNHPSVVDLLAKIVPPTIDTA